MTASAFGKDDLAILFCCSGAEASRSTLARRKMLEAIIGQRCLGNKMSKRPGLSNYMICAEL